MATQVAERPAPTSPAREIRETVTDMGAELKKALPSHISVEKFQRVAMTSINSDPDLLYADRRSLFEAITRAAQDGLLPDKREGAFVIFNSKVKTPTGDQWIKKVQWMPMVAGILKKCRQSGEIATLSAQIVYANDMFVWSLGDDESIEHVPVQLGQDRGEPIGAYAIAVLKDGFRFREVMDLPEIQKVRAASRSGDKGPWKDWWSEMAKKTVIRRLAKRLPMSTDLESVINDDTTSLDFAGAALADGGPQPLTRQMLQHQADGVDDGPAADADTDQSLTDDGAMLRGETSDDRPDWADPLDLHLARVDKAENVVDLNAAISDFTVWLDDLPDAERDSVLAAERAASDRLNIAAGG